MSEPLRTPARRGFEAAGFALGAVLVLASYPETVGKYYGGTALPQGLGMEFVVPTELAHLALYATWAAAATLLLALALHRTDLPRRVGSRLLAVAHRPATAWAAAAVLVLVMSAVVGRGVLGDAAVSDDEHVYQLVARTLRTGHVTSPSPGGDLPHFQEQFVVLTDSARYGKYPVGHPALLALGGLVGAERLVVPLLSAVVVLLSGWLARDLFGDRASVLAVALLAVSPQFVLTGATWLSQPASAACVLAAAACVLRARSSPRALAWCAGAGLAGGYAFLVRLMPGAAIAALAVAGVALLAREATPAQRLVRACAAGAGVAVSVAVFLAVNHAQTGRLLGAGYQAYHGLDTGMKGLLVEPASASVASASMSLFSALLRLDVWFLGWPGALLACAFAPRVAGDRVLHALLAVAVVYRLLVPKAGIAPTGPIYMYEAVPVLAILAGAALARAAEAPSWIPRAAGSIVLAGTIVGATLFVPARVADLARMGAAQNAVLRLVAARTPAPALVFHRGTVPPWTAASWAYFPPCNGPGLDDHVVFARQLGAAPGDPVDVDFWRRRYPGRPAFWFSWPQGGRPELVGADGSR